MINSTSNPAENHEKVKMQCENYILSCYSVQNITDNHKRDFVTVKNIINIFYPSQKHHDGHENGKSERKNYIITCGLNQMLTLKTLECPISTLFMRKRPVKSQFAIGYLIINMIFHTEPHHVNINSFNTFILYVEHQFNENRKQHYYIIKGDTTHDR